MLIATIASVAVVIVVLIAFVMMPSLKGLVGQNYLHDGDFIDYDVTGTALFFPIDGKVRIDVSNVTIDGFTATVNFTGVPGFESAIHDFTWDDNVWAFLEIGTKTGTANISTPWGMKHVDVHMNQNGSDAYTTYIGTDPAVVYRVDITGMMYTATVTMANTTIDIVKTGNPG